MKMTPKSDVLYKTGKKITFMEGKSGAKKWSQK
jgi:hypothetical protein